MISRYSRFYNTSAKLPSLRSLNSLFNGIELVLMDIDGTALSNTVPHYRKHLDFAYASYTKKDSWTHEHYTQYREITLHKHGVDFVSHDDLIAAMIGVEIDHEHVTNMASVFYTSFEEDSHTPPLFPYFRELLCDLNELKIPVLAFSNNDHRLIQTMLARHDVHTSFFDIVCNTRKPSPDILHEVLMRHPELPDTSGDHVLVVGDSLETDGGLAKNSGSKFVYFVAGLEPQLQEQSYIEAQKKKEQGLIPEDTVIVHDFSAIRAALSNDLLVKNVMTLKN